jgi:hypothetical protein
MNFILEFNEWKPDPKQIQFWQNYVEEHYPVKMYDGAKFIIIDENPLYITGNYSNKGRLIQKLFLDIQGNFQGEIHEPSLRKAIKFWYDSQDYVQI